MKARLKDRFHPGRFKVEGKVKAFKFFVGGVLAGQSRIQGLEKRSVFTVL